MLTRRHLLRGIAAGALAGRVRAQTTTRVADAPWFQTRGVVLTPEDLTLHDWPERVAAAGLNTVGLHHPLSPRKLVTFIQSEAGTSFLQQCRALKLDIEYELHAMQELLPRDLFGTSPELFRMNEKGERVGDANLCVHSRRGMEIVVEHALELARRLRPTTHRYFFWGDDGLPWCRCPQCAGLSDSDQAMMVENRVIGALQRIDPKAELAHLAYHNTLPPPRQVRPAPGIFLEYAPIERRYDLPLQSTGEPKNQRDLELLDANLALFGRERARVLEYWLDVSLFSKWKKPAVKLSFKPDVLAADLNTYGSRGIRQVSTFAVYLDADYVRRFGEPPLGEYGRQLTTWRPTRLGSK